MNVSEYGNISWHYYVYGSYGIMLVCLGAYTFFSLQVRKRALKSLKDEGFLN